MFIPKMIKLLVILFLIKWLNSKKNPCRRIETLSEKKPFLHNKFWSIYWEVLSGVWPNFAVVKYNSKISNIYHQIKFRRRLMNRFSIKKLFLQIPQHSQKNSGVGVSFQIKMQAFSLETLFKRGSNTSVFLWILRNL